MADDATKWWQKFGNAAQIAQCVFTAFGVAFVLIQINALENVNRAAGARQIYLGYLEKEFQYPQFAAPNYDRIRDSSPEERTRYESFVSYMLYSCEEALAAFSGQPEWVNTCDEEVKQHLRFLCEKTTQNAGYLRTYADRTVDFVKRAMTRYGVASPECKVTRT